MAKSLTTLRALVRSEVRDPDSIRFSDDELDDAINPAYRSAYLTVLAADVGYFAATTTHNIVADTATVTLPSDHYKTIRIEYTDGDITIPLFENNRGVTPNATVASTYNAGISLFTYFFRGNSLVLEPTPQTAVTDGLVHEYIRTLTSSDDLTTGSDTVHADFKDIWCDVIVLDAAINLLSQIEAEGAEVSTNLVNRYKKSMAAMENTLNIRTKSPNRGRRFKGYFR